MPWSAWRLKSARIGFVDELAPSGPGKLDLGPINVDVAGLASTGDKPAKLDATVTIADGQTLKHTGELALTQGTLAGTLESTGLRPQGFAAWWPRALRSQFGDTGINAELHYKMAWSQPVFQFTLEKSRLELSPVYVATREPIVLPATPAAAERPANANGAPHAPNRLPEATMPATTRATAGAAGCACAPRRRSGGRQAAAGRAEKLVLENISLDLARQNFEAGQVSLVKPQIAATRDYHGELLEMARIWAVESAEQKAAPAPAVPTTPAAPAAGATNGRNGAAAPPGWKVRLGKVTVEGRRAAGGLRAGRGAIAAGRSSISSAISA